MSESKELHDAVCGDCGLAFRVPSPDKTYACKSCGGVVGVPRACAACGVENDPGAAFCDACGEALAAEAEPSKPARSRPKTSKRSQRELSARADFHGMLRAIRNVQTLLLVQALGATLISTLVVFAWIEIAREAYHYGRPVDLGAPFRMYVSVLLFTAVSWMGVIYGRWAPRPWALVSAVCTSLMTLGVLALELASPVHVPRLSWIVAFAALVAWVAVVRLAPLGRRLAEHGDLSIAELLREGGVVRNRHQRTPRRPGWMPAVVAGLAVVGATIFALRVFALPGLPGIEEAAARFEEAWSEDQSSALLEAFPGSRRIFGRMDRLSTVEAWDGDFPELGPRRDLKTGREAMTTWWETDRGTLRVVWRLEDEAWRPRTLALPDGK